MTKRQKIENYIIYKIKRFEKLEEMHANVVSAELATLRRGIGKRPGEAPELYGIFLKDMPEDFWNVDGNITPEEWSCYIAMTLFALHQQGNTIKSACMHTDENVSVGTALRKLSNVQKKTAGDSNVELRIGKKLQMLITSKDIDELENHLRAIIKLLKNERIAINYSRLAKDIYSFQFEEAKEKVSLLWGHDFYRDISAEDKENEQ